MSQTQSSPEFLDKLYTDEYLLDISIQHIYPLIKKYIESNPELKGNLIDVGCGKGNILQAARDHFESRFEYHGLDLFECQDNNEKNPIYFKQTDLNQNFSEAFQKKFDLVISCEVIEHVIDTDHYIKQIKNLLHKNGIFIVTSPNLSSFFNRILLSLWIPTSSHGSILGKPLFRTRKTLQTHRTR